MALDMGIGAKDFWEEFTPKGVLLLAKQRAKLDRRKPGKAKKPAERTQDIQPEVRINRIPR